MPRKLVEVEVPEGTRLGFAQDSEGGMRGLLFDSTTNKLVGHAELFDHEADEDSWGSGSGDYDGDDDDNGDEIDEIAEIIGTALAILAIRGIEAAAPHLKDWWNGKAAPALKSAPGKVRAKLKRSKGRTEQDGQMIAVELIPADSQETPDPTEGGQATLQPAGPTMSSAEAEERLAYAVAAMAFAREQMRLLQTARIVDDDGLVELASTLNEFTPERIEQAVHLMLEANPSLARGQDLLALKVGLGTGAEHEPIPVEHHEPEGERDEADE